MPIFEYKCNECSEDFEKLVFGSSPDVSCPKCNSKNVNKKFSLFGMSGVEKPVTSAGGSGCSSCSSSSCKSCS
jgi:putative FmdB family regulatory protein